MLTESQKKILEQAFAAIISKELSIEQTKAIAEKTKLPLRFVEWFALAKDIVPLRYERNIGNLGIEGQKKLLSSRCLVIGLGGLGGFVYEELARVGIGKIACIDPDVIEETNLNRQLLADEKNFGKKKTAEARKRIRKINAAVEFKGFSSLFSDVPEQIWEDTDLVFDCLDNIKDRLILAEKCSASNIPLVHGAIAGFCGEVGVIWPGTELLQKVYSGQIQGIEKQLGTPSFTAAFAASLMVAEGVKILIGINVKKERKIHFFDLMEDQWQSVTL